jgi:hypothetical protein
VGFDEREALERDRGYPLKVVTVMQGGQYIADVHVTIRDASGALVLDARMNGPWLMADLPPGRYRLVADFGGVTQTRDFTVSGSRRQEIVLRWQVDESTATGPAMPIR